MFTGIITQTGKVERVAEDRLRVRAAPAFVRKIKMGMSVAVDGACVTAVARGKSWFEAELMPETKKKTTLGAIAHHSLVNLELPITPQAFLSGHIVKGHVDGVAQVKGIEKKGASRIVALEAPREISKYMVGRGSVAVNGISLTIIKTSRNRFLVGIIPHTWRSTNLRELEIGDTVNIEVDVLAKYTSKLLSYSRE